MLNLGRALGLVLLLAVLAWRFLEGRLRTYAVAGDSMRPALTEGDWLLIDRHARPDIGDVVVAIRPDDDTLEVVKRVGAREPDGRLVLLGDNPEASTDSRHWGSVAPDAVQGVVRLRYWPLSRVGPIGRAPAA